MKRMVLIPEEKLIQYEQQKGGKTFSDTPLLYPLSAGQVWSSPQLPQFGYGKKDEERELSNDIIVRGIPKTMKNRATALLEHLKTKPDAISWDDMGQVTINGTLIQKSNISDLVSNAMRSRKNFNPKGSEEFFSVLSDLNVPRDLIRNEGSMNNRKPKRKVNQKGGFGGMGFAGWMDDMATGIAKLGTPLVRKAADRMTRKELGDKKYKIWKEKRDRALREKARKARKARMARRAKKQKGRGKSRTEKTPKWECYKG